MNQTHRSRAAFATPVIRTVLLLLPISLFLAPAVAEAHPVRRPVVIVRRAPPPPPVVIVREVPRRYRAAPREVIVIREREDVWRRERERVVTTRPDYRANGLIIGAIAGAIIGNNSGSLGHNAWRGAAIGAGAGYVIGSVAEANARVAETREAVREPARSVRTEAPDARRVPDAPTFDSPARPSGRLGNANSLFGR
jgi:uncharacterized protein YcfJ